MNILLTKSTMPIVKWVAELLGLLMNGIFYVIDAIGIPNVGVAIIIYTIVMYLLMTPLQIKQQKFSKMNAVMAPELNKIRKKYENKKDQVSMQKMNEETQAVYAKYGVSATGSCVQLLIQMPVLFGLYQVIYHIPGYIGVIGTKLGELATASGFETFFREFVNGLEKAGSLTFVNDTKEAVIDVIYKLNPSQWSGLIDASKGESFANILNDVHAELSEWTYFLGLNISDSPSSILSGAWASKSWIMIIAAIAFPVLAWFTQMLNYKLMPQASNGNSNDTMNNTMKSMNTFMPIMSAIFCFTLPVGVGIYWIVSAVVRGVQQVIINKKLDKIDVDELIKKNLEKVNKKREKQGLPPQKITNQAKANVRHLEVDEEVKAKKQQNAQKKLEDSTAYYNSSNSNPKSIASKANMVKQFEERSGKKK